MLLFFVEAQPTAPALPPVAPPPPPAMDFWQLRLHLAKDTAPLPPPREAEPPLREGAVNIGSLLLAGIFAAVYGEAAHLIPR